MRDRPTMPAVGTKVRAGVRGWTAAAFATLTAATLVLVAAPAQAVPAFPSSVFDLNSVSWYSNRNQSLSGYNSTEGTRRNQNQILIDFEVDISNNNHVVGSVWQTNVDSRDWIFIPEMTGAQLQTNVNSFSGMRVVEQETYVRNGTRYYAALWHESNNGASFHGLTYSSWVNHHNSQIGAGRVLVDIDTYQVGTNDYRILAVYAPNVDNLNTSFRFRQLGVDFDATITWAQNSGYRPITLDIMQGPSPDNHLWYSSQWVQNTSGRDWQVRRNRTSSQYASDWSYFTSNGYRLVEYDRYTINSGTVRYAAIWRQND